MKHLDELKSLFQMNNGILKTAQIESLKIDYRGIQRFIDYGYIEKIKNGYYKWVDFSLDDEAIVSGLFPDGVLCMDSALYFYGYEKKRPLYWHISVDKNTSKSRFKLEYPYIKPYYVEPEVLGIGVSNIRIKNSVFKIYNKDRLICDCIRYETKMDRDMFQNAIKSYLNDPEKSIHRLMEYAQQRNVFLKAESMLGAWI